MQLLKLKKKKSLSGTSLVERESQIKDKIEKYNLKLNHLKS